MKKQKNSSQARSSLKAYIFRSSIIYSFIIIAVFGILLGTTFYLSAMSGARSTLQKTNHALVFFIEGYFNEIINNVSILASEAYIIEAMEGDEDDHQEILNTYRTFSEANEKITYVYSGYENGLMLINNWEAPGGYDPTRRPWYEKAMEVKPDMSVGLPYQEINDREWLTSTSKALRDKEGSYTGVVTIDCSIAEIARLLRCFGDFEKGYSFVVGQDGEIILHHKEQFLGETIPEIKNALQSGSYGNFTYRAEKVEKLAFFRTVPDTDWQVVTVVERNEIVLPILWRVIGLLVIISCLAILLGLVQSNVMSRHLYSPIKALSDKVRAVVAGEEYEEEPAVYPDNEFGVIARDIGQLTASELYRKNKELQYLTYHDQLTGLYNHRFFEVQMGRLDVCRQLPISLIVGDVNGLKKVNDKLGHRVGDQLLQASADILRQAFRSEDIIARWGGDEFCIILPKTTYSKAQEILVRIDRLCSEYKAEQFSVSIAFGCATKENSDENLDDVFQKAEKRMYNIKKGNSGSSGFSAA